MRSFDSSSLPRCPRLKTTAREHFKRLPQTAVHLLCSRYSTGIRNMVRRTVDCLQRYTSAAMSINSHGAGSDDHRRTHNSGLPLQLLLASSRAITSRRPADVPRNSMLISPCLTRTRTFSPLYIPFFAQVQVLQPGIDVSAPPPPPPPTPARSSSGIPQSRMFAASGVEGGGRWAGEEGGGHQLSGGSHTADTEAFAIDESEGEEPNFVDEGTAGSVGGKEGGGK